MTRLIASSAVLCGGDDPGRPAWLPAGVKRRLDPLMYLACQATAAILPETGLPAATAVIFATAWGNLRSTQSFLDSIAAYGDAGASPSPFTTSVHNAAQGVLCQLLDLHGPGFTISQGNCSALQALHLARGLVQRAGIPRALVVAGDLHTGWSRSLAERLCGGARRIGGGATAMLLAADGAGPTLTATPPGAPAINLLANGDDPTDPEHRLAERALGAWWPTCLPAAIPSRIDRAWRLRECEGGRCEELFLLP